MQSRLYSRIPKVALLMQVSEFLILYRKSINNF
nr:MAG TPA: hypothetical protein [Caudoviricetes sp.]